MLSLEGGSSPPSIQEYDQHNACDKYVSAMPHPSMDGPKTGIYRSAPVYSMQQNQRSPPLTSSSVDGISGSAHNNESSSHPTLQQIPVATLAANDGPANCPCPDCDLSRPAESMPQIVMPHPEYTISGADIAVLDTRYSVTQNSRGTLVKLQTSPKKQLAQSLPSSYYGVRESNDSSLGLPITRGPLKRRITSMTSPDDDIDSATAVNAGRLAKRARRIGENGESKDPKYVLTCETVEINGARYCRVYRRPPISYADLITYAIAQSPQKKLKLQAIYYFLTSTFGYFKHHTAKRGWENSIRHNLSMKSRCRFMKVKDQCDSEKGSYWHLNPDPNHYRDTIENAFETAERLEHWPGILYYPLAPHELQPKSAFLFSEDERHYTDNLCIFDEVAGIFQKFKNLQAEPSRRKPLTTSLNVASAVQAATICRTDFSLPPPPYRNLTASVPGSEDYGIYGSGVSGGIIPQQSSSSTQTVRPIKMDAKKSKKRRDDSYKPTSSVNLQPLKEQRLGVGDNAAPRQARAPPAYYAVDYPNVSPPADRNARYGGLVMACPVDETEFEAADARFTMECPLPRSESNIAIFNNGYAHQYAENTKLSPSKDYDYGFAEVDVPPEIPDEETVPWDYYNQYAMMATASKRYFEEDEKTVDYNSVTGPSGLFASDNDEEGFGGSSNINTSGMGLLFGASQDSAQTDYHVPVDVSSLDLARLIADPSVPVDSSTGGFF